MRDSARRLEYIDSLRGIAAITVVFFHIIGYMSRNALDAGPDVFTSISQMLVNSLNLGLFGVALFFLISGFIIPYSLHEKTNLGRFAISRFFRLYPAFWISIILTALIGPYVGTNSFSGLQIFANATMVPKIFHQELINGVYWTLFIELLFYVCCAFLFASKKLENIFLIGSIAIGLSLVTPLTIVMKHFFLISVPLQFITFHLSFLFLGSLIRLSIIDEKNTKNFLYVSIFLHLLTIPLVSGCYFALPPELAGKLTESKPLATAIAYFFALVVFILAVSTMKPTGVIWKFLGSISYSLYLIHWLCCLVILYFFPLHSFWDQLILIFGGMALSIMVAFFMYIFIEKPSIALGKSFSKKR